MKNTNLVGVVPPMITPFDSNGEVDENALKELVSFLASHVQGLFICGTYGSGPLMESDQRKKVAEIVTKQIDGKINVMVHAGSTNTKTAVDIAKHAESIGATHVSSVPPYYYKHNKEEVLLYFGSLVKAVTTIPVYVYNNPKLAGYEVSPELLNELADLGVAGVKDSSFDIMVLNNYIRRVTKKNFDVVLGTEAMFLSASVLGIKAFIPGLGNAFPELMVELYKACTEERFKEAREIQNKVLILRDLMHMTGSNISAVHEMLKFRNVNAGLPKSPYIPLTKEKSSVIYKRLNEVGVI